MGMGIPIPVHTSTWDQTSDILLTERCSRDYRLGVKKFNGKITKAFNMSPLKENYGFEHRPRRQGQGGAGVLASWKCCKVFCVLAVTVNTLVLRATTRRKGRQLFSEKSVPCQKSCGRPWL